MTMQTNLFASKPLITTGVAAADVWNALNSPTVATFV
jgi:hypothetical protein